MLFAAEKKETVAPAPGMFLSGRKHQSVIFQCLGIGAGTALRVVMPLAHYGGNV